MGLGIATGGDDPVSTNQTLGGGGSTKDVRLDLAYGKWQATDNIYLAAGKIKNPFYRPQKTAFMWDGDYNPEGSVSDFEFLYRQHLICLYEMIGEESPDYLDRVFSHGGGTPQTGGVMRPGSD